jgi:AcrR family transcriptional regulator
MADKKEEIINAALELIAEHGFHGAPMAMIAERAGVAAGTIYRYFESKDILIREIYSWLEGEIWRAVKEHYPAEGPIRERYLHIIKCVTSYFLASPLAFRFIEQFQNSPYGVDCRREKIFERKEKDLMFDLFELGKQQRIIKDLPVSILFSLSFGPLINACRDHILEFIQMDEALIDKIVEACWDAVKQ